MAEENGGVTIDNVDIRIKIKPPTKAQISKVNEAASAMDRLRISYSSFAKTSGDTTALSNITAGLKTVSKSYPKTASLKSSSTSAALGLGGFGKAGALIASIALLRKGVQLVGNWVTKSNEYVENLNLFTVSMGKFANEAFEYGQTVEKVMGINLSEWIRGQGVFNQIAFGFGIAEENAYAMSKGLTQLSYDLASFFNLSTEEAMNKVRSGISGELEPLRNLGYALDQATLQQVAYNHGITKNVAAMTQAEKAQIRYIAIMEQSQNAIGDMARTLDSPANSIRVLNAQFDILGRTLGQLFTPLVMEIVPILSAVTQITTELVRNFAALIGVELPKIEDTFNGSVADSWEEATEAAKEYKNTLLGFDEINRMGSTIGGNLNTGLGGDLGIDFSQYDYDFLGEANKKVEEIKKSIKDLFNDPTVKTWIDTLKQGFGVLKTVGETAYGIFGELKTHILEPFVENLLPKVTSWGEDVGDLLQDIQNHEVWSSLEKTFGTLFEVAEPFVGEVGNLLDFTSKINSTVAKFAWDALLEKIDLLSDGLGAIGDLFTGDLDDALKGFGKIFTDTFINNLGKVKELEDGIKRFADLDYSNSPIINTFKSLGQLIVGIEEFVEADVEDKFDTLFEGIADAFITQFMPIKNAIDSIVSFLDEVGESLGLNGLSPKPDTPTLKEYWDSIWAEPEENTAQTSSIGGVRNGRDDYEIPPNVKLKIPAHARGGFVEDGLFMANSREIVGKFTNGKTAVANNAQIVGGISAGVAKANSQQNELLREQNALLKRLISISGNAKAIVTTHDIVDSAKRLNQREGITIIPVG